MKKKFIFLNLKVVNGEYEYSCNSVHQLNIDENSNKFAEQYASKFYNSKPEKTDGWYYFNGGEVAVRVREIKELTQKNYLILNRYI